MDLNRLGLILNIAGSIILLFFNFPTKHINPPSLIVKNLSDQEANWNTKVRCFAYLGLVLMILGFICQLIYTY